MTQMLSLQRFNRHDNTVRSLYPRQLYQEHYIIHVFVSLRGWDQKLISFKLKFSTRQVLWNGKRKFNVFAELIVL